MQSRHFIALGAFNMCVAIAAGAFGAHALKELLNTDMLAIWQTAAHYHTLHAIGLMVIGILMNQNLSQDQNQLKIEWLNRAGIAMFIGIILFSGSLYILAITGIKILGAITPLGGLAFIVAWLGVAYAVLKK